MRKIKKLSAVILSIVLILCSSACSDEYDEGYDDDYKYDEYDGYDEYGYDGDDYYDEDDYDEFDFFGDDDYDDYGGYDSDGYIPEGDVDSVTGMTMSVDNSTGTLSISRRDVDKGKKTDDGIWTIFVYLCGTDLETDSGMGASDMDEMAAAAKSDKVRFIVETGGTDDWTNSTVDEGKIQRFIIQNGKTEKVDEGTLTNMGLTETLSDFLVWGTSEYNSEHMGLIMWNHGGGCITGVCFDEKYDQDSLTLMEIDAALLKCTENMGRKFDFVGFDACLMGTIETANVLATYSDYMFGSEEMEPGSGWDYTAIGSYIAAHPDVDTVELGKEVCDSFYESCKRDDDEEMATLAVIDLSKIDELLINFNVFAKNMYDVGEDSAETAEMIRGIGEADNFGGNNKTEGYTNMVDLGGVIDACSQYADGAAAAKKALNAAVVYKISGSTHESAMGLSVYYPLAIQGSNELSLFGKISVSPYYLSFVDRLGKTGATDYGFEQYDDSQWFDDSDEWSWWDAADDENYWDYLDNYEQTGESPYITFSEEAAVDDDGSFGLTLDQNGINNASSIYALVYELTEDEQEVIELGETVDIVGDWDSGHFTDNFDGYWLSLSDGQNLATYIVEETDEYVVYTSPVLLNGEETNLRIIQYYNGYIEVEGAWNGINEQGAASREIIKLTDGDVICPVYYAYSLDTDDESEYTGAEYTVQGAVEINYSLMAEGEYYYSFCIDDIYGDYYLTDFTAFVIDEDGNIYF